LIFLDIEKNNDLTNVEAMTGAKGRWQSKDNEKNKEIQ